ncbi:galactose mutarotase [Neokomagataea thailandica NBRC 106555]|uniref:Aldose 1-epimerase family protein n=2 Tax=Neokomagataea TaxID=1223423 RepID=A0A4Y6V5L7_9PROT|nr:MULTISPECIES: aldose 1-epimerase family protein [Neokomagataea]QDH25359.1 aldose 1-epimerase family protein [Neokomagataea tanensis]GBR53599.1 galactose mutarotase [Neokomagataea thailandica NBRC 106555]
MISDASHEFKNNRLCATVAAHGAELQRLQYTSTLGQQREMLWEGTDPWARHSPILFPIVGKLPDDCATLDGQIIRMSQHGFARDCRFDWVERTETSCTLELRDNAETRAFFPRKFILRVKYTLENDTINIIYSVINTDEYYLPMSIGAHPAFKWPIIPDTPKTQHRLIFSHNEEKPTGRLKKDGLVLKCSPSPVIKREVALSEDLFQEGAIIFEALSSRELQFVTSSGEGLEMSWTNLPSLGLWMIPGSNFLCIEPWQGYATPAGFKGDFTDKPGLISIPPREQWEAQWKVRGIG